MISVIIVSYNGIRFIKRLIESLEMQTYRDFELIIVDNNSVQDNVSLYLDNSFRTAYIGLARNRGFSYAVNTGMKYASCQYVVLLNNDIYLNRDFMQCAYNDMQSNRGVFFAPIVYSYNGNVIDSAGDSMDGEYKPFKCRHVNNYDRIYSVDAISMSACFFRKRDFLRVGGLKNAFFLYFEDAEFSLRAGRMGFAFCVDPRAKAYHYISAATKAISGSDYSSLKTYYEARNRILLLKSEETIRLIMHLPLVIKGTLSSIVFHMFNTHYCLDYINGLFAALTEMHRI